MILIMVESIINSMPDEFSSTRDRSFPELVERNPSFISRNINEPLEGFVNVFRNRHNDSFASGLFELPLPEQSSVLGTGAADMKNRAYQFYYDTLCDFAYALPHSAKWAVFIRPHNQTYLMDQISNMNDYEPNKSVDDWNFGHKADYLTLPKAQETIGCIFALGVSQAGHSLGVSNSGGTGGTNHGFIKSPISQGRSDNQTIELIVKETNSSYTDFVLRPWSILASHFGFHARPNDQSIKSDITIFEMDYTYTKEQPMVRKVFNYYDCLPININQENLDYEADKVIQRQIQFAYNNYTIQGGENYSLRGQVNDVPQDPQPVFDTIIPSNSK